MPAASPPSSQYHCSPIPPSLGAGDKFEPPWGAGTPTPYHQRPRSATQAVRSQVQPCPRVRICMTPTGTPLLSWGWLSHSGDESEHVLLSSARPILDRGRSQIDIVSRGVAQIVDLIVVQQVGTPFFQRGADPWEWRGRWRASPRLQRLRRVWHAVGRPAFIHNHTRCFCAQPPKIAPRTPRTPPINAPIAALLVPILIDNRNQSNSG